MLKNINLLYIKERASVFLDLYIYLIIKSGFNYVSEYKKKIYLYFIFLIIYLSTPILMLKVRKL